MSEDRVVPTLVVQLMQQSQRDAAFTSNVLIDSLTRETRKQEATLLLIREDMAMLLHGPYMPSAAAIEAALYPSRERVAALAEDLRIKRGES